jgi:hypothetical protein
MPVIAATISSTAPASMSRQAMRTVGCDPAADDARRSDECGTPQFTIACPSAV